MIYMKKYKQNQVYKDLYKKYDGKYGDLVQTVATFVVRHGLEPEFRNEVLK